MIKIFWSSRVTKKMTPSQMVALERKLRTLAASLGYNVIDVKTTMKGNALQITMFYSDYIKEAEKNEEA